MTVYLSEKGIKVNPPIYIRKEELMFCSKRLRLLYMIKIAVHDMKYGIGLGDNISSEKTISLKLPKLSKTIASLYHSGQP